MVTCKNCGEPATWAHVAYGQLRLVALVSRPVPPRQEDDYQDGGPVAHYWLEQDATPRREGGPPPQAYKLPEALLEQACAADLILAVVHSDICLKDRVPFT